MHIEPGVVSGAKLILSYGTAVAAAGYSLKLIADDLKEHNALSFLSRAVAAWVVTFICFEVLPHFPVGVSEVHIILGTTLLLLFGAGPAAVGLAAGLATQSAFFAPTDLPMYAVNVTTLLVPLFAIREFARRAIPADKPYVGLRYMDVLKLSFIYQGGVVAWVAFWALYGQGFGVLGEVASFGAAYMLVIIIEPIVDLGVLATAKALHRFKDAPVFTKRLHHGAA